MCSDYVCVCFRACLYCSSLFLFSCRTCEGRVTCTDSPCRNVATCEDNTKEQGVTCHCSFGYDGVHCQSTYTYTFIREITCKQSTNNCDTLQYIRGGNISWEKSSRHGRFVLLCLRVVLACVHIISIKQIYTLLECTE